MAGRAWLLPLVVALAMAPRAAAEITIPETREIVVDTAGVITPADKQRISGWLEELRQKTTAEVKVLTVKNTDGEDFFSFAQRQYDTWKLGLKGKDNGAIILLDVEGHHARIHTGRGLEGVMPDSWCGTALRLARDQFFKAGKYSEGMTYLATIVANRVADDAGVKLTGVPDRRLRPQPQNDANVALVMVIIFAIILIFSIFQSRRRGGPGMWQGYGGPFFGGFGGGALGGGSFGGGSFGGSSGGGFYGGGGSSAGGGATTSW